MHPKVDGSCQRPTDCAAALPRANWCAIVGSWAQWTVMVTELLSVFGAIAYSDGQDEAEVPRPPIAIVGAIKCLGLAVVWVHRPPVYGGFLRAESQA